MNYGHDHCLTVQNSLEYSVIIAIGAYALNGEVGAALIMLDADSGSVLQRWRPSRKTGNDCHPCRLPWDRE